MNDLSLIVLTHNEELHIERCLKSVEGLVKNIYIIDSNSDDNTIEISKKFKTINFFNKWPGSQSKQLEWFFSKIDIKTDWVLRLDADEYLLPDLKHEIGQIISNSEKWSDVGGFLMKRRLIFMDKWIKNGGYYPVKIVRLWKNNHGYWEDKDMDEHFIVNKGKTLCLKHDFVDHNLNKMEWWINKHNNYSSREVLNYFKSSISISNLSKDKQFYNKFPLGIRPFFSSYTDILYY